MVKEPPLLVDDVDWEDPALKRMPFLMLTSEAVRENVFEAIEAGVDYYIVKPFTVKGLEEKIDLIFQRHAALKEMK